MVRIIIYYPEHLEGRGLISQQFQTSIQSDGETDLWWWYETPKPLGYASM